MLVKHFPPKVQKALDILFKIMILIFLGILVYYGILMTKTGWKRQITALGISYGWVTMAVPTGAFFMMISTTIKLVERIKTPAGQEIKKEAGRELARCITPFLSFWCCCFWACPSPSPSASAACAFS